MTQARSKLADRRQLALDGTQGHEVSSTSIRCAIDAVSGANTSSERVNDIAPLTAISPVLKICWALRLYSNQNRRTMR